MASFPSRDDDMGQTSSQLALPQSSGEFKTMANPGKARQRSSKRSKKKIVEPEQAIDQEQESARALIQLAQGGLGEASAMRTGNHLTRSQVPKRYMTSQERIDSEVEKLEIERRRKRRKKTQKKHEVSNALAELQVEGTQQLGSNQPSTPLAQQDHTPSDQHQNARHGCSHPLDDVSTDEEVEEFTKGTLRIEGIKDSYAQEAEQLRQTQDEQLVLPAYSASQRMRAVDVAMREDSRPKKKRKRASENPSYTESMEFEGHDISEQPSRIESAHYTQDLHHPSSLVELQQGESSVADTKNHAFHMPIDPSLDDWSHQAPGAAKSPIRSGHSKERRSIIAKKRQPSKRKKSDTLVEDDQKGNVDEDEKPYISPYVTLERPIENHADDVGNPSGNEAEDKQKRNERGNAAQLPNRLNGKSKFGRAEIEKIERFRESWCEMNGKQLHHFNEIIQSNIRGSPTAVLLFKDLQDMFPSHRSSYIQRFCRRKFHNFAARGTWSTRDDDMLRQAVAEKGTSWKAVGEVIDRFPEDCRDRWRNYLVNMEHRNREQWTDGEILNLARAILDCVRNTKTESQQQEVDNADPNFQPFEPDIDLENIEMKLINWQDVSDRMGFHGGARSRLQCSFKWNKLKTEDQMRFLREAYASRRMGTSVFHHPSENQTKLVGWRTAQARKKVSNMLSGDKIDLLQAILDSTAYSEGNIPWKSIGLQWFQERWSTTERKSAWLMLKESIEVPEDEDYRHTVYRLLQEIPEAESNDRWDSSQYDSMHPRPPQRPYSKPRVKRDKGKAKQPLNTPENGDKPSNLRRRSNGFLLGNNDARAVSDSDLDGNDEYRPSGDQSRPEDAFPGLDPLLTAGPKTRQQKATLNGGTHHDEPNGINGIHNSMSEAHRQQELSMEHGEIPADLHTRILGLKNA